MNSHARVRSESHYCPPLLGPRVQRLATRFCLALAVGCAACAQPPRAPFPFEYFVKGGTQAPHRDLDQVWYCGPNGSAIADRQRQEGTLPASAQNLDDLCGRSLIVLHRTGGTAFPETRPTSVEIFKSTNYLADEPPRVIKDKKPTAPYLVVGTFEFPERWYFASTRERYVAESVGKLGGDAVLEYETFQDAAGVATDPFSGEVLDVQHMSMKGTVIKFVEH